MARNREFDETAVVRAVRDVFWRRGYVATSIADLEQATGLSRSSLYAAFGSKRKLFALATANYVDEIINPLLAPLERPGAGQEELAGYFGALAAFFREAADCEGPGGCLTLNSIVDLYAIDEEAADEVRRQVARTTAAFLNALRSMDDRVPDPAARAELLTLAQIGILTTSRVDSDAAVRLADLQAREIASW